MRRWRGEAALKRTHALECHFFRSNITVSSLLLSHIRSSASFSRPQSPITEGNIWSLGHQRLPQGIYFERHVLQFLLSTSATSLAWKIASCSVPAVKSDRPSSSSKRTGGGGSSSMTRTTEGLTFGGGWKSFLPMFMTWSTLE
jgi:hypothetical protein